MYTKNTCITNQKTKGVYLLQNWKIVEWSGDIIYLTKSCVQVLTYSLITVNMATELPLSPSSVAMDEGDCSEMIPNGLSLPRIVTVACVYSRRAAPPVALLSCTTKLCVQKKYNIRKKTYMSYKDYSYWESLQAYWSDLRFLYGVCIETNHAHLTSSTSGKSSGRMVREIVCRLALVMNWRLPEVGRMSAEGSPPRERGRKETVMEKIAIL